MECNRKLISLTFYIDLIVVNMFNHLDLNGKLLAHSLSGVNRHFTGAAEKLTLGSKLCLCLFSHVPMHKVAQKERPLDLGGLFFSLSYS